LGCVGSAIFHRRFDWHDDTKSLELAQYRARKSKGGELDDRERASSISESPPNHNLSTSKTWRHSGHKSWWLAFSSGSDRYVGEWG
jgi:hypothetical protein